MSDQERAAVMLALRLASRGDLLDAQNAIFEFRRAGVESDLMALAAELLAEAHADEGYLA